MWVFSWLLSLSDTARVRLQGVLWPIIQKSREKKEQQISTACQSSRVFQLKWLYLDLWSFRLPSLISLFVWSSLGTATIKNIFFKGSGLGNLQWLPTMIGKCGIESHTQWLQYRSQITASLSGWRYWGTLQAGWTHEYGVGTWGVFTASVIQKKMIYLPKRLCPPSSPPAWKGNHSVHITSLFKLEMKSYKSTT